MTRVRIDRQAETVARLSRELRFELLLLRRIRARTTGRRPADDTPHAFASLAEVYAAALLRRARDEGA